MKIYISALLSLALITTAFQTNAQATDTHNKQDASGWDKAQDSTDKALEKSSKAAKDIWDATKETTSELLQDGQETSSKLWESTKEGSNSIWLESQDLWKENNDKLKEFLKNEDENKSETEPEPIRI